MASLVEGVGVGEGLRVGAVGGDVGGVNWISFRRGQFFFFFPKKGGFCADGMISSTSGFGVK